jgi:hypothetical protein
MIGKMTAVWFPISAFVALVCVFDFGWLLLIDYVHEMAVLNYFIIISSSMNYIKSDRDLITLLQICL